MFSWVPMNLGIAESDAFTWKISYKNDYRTDWIDYSVSISTNYEAVSKPSLSVKTIASDAENSSYGMCPKIWKIKE